MADRNLGINLSVKTGNSKAEIEAVRRITEDWGEDGKKAAQSVASGLAGVEKGYDLVEKKIRQGRAVTGNETVAMAQSLKNLEMAIKSTFGSLENAPAQVQAAFRKAEGQLDTTTTKVKELTRATDEQRGSLTKAGENWDGLGKEIEKAAGPMGKYIAKAGLLATAFTEGWNVGMKLNKLFGTDMAEWERVTTSFGDKVGALIEAMSTNVVNFFTVVMDVATGNFSALKRDLKILWDDGKQGAETFKAAVATTFDPTAWNAYSESIGKTTVAIRDLVAEAAILTANQALATDVTKAATEAAKQQIAEEEKFAEQIGKLVVEHDALAESSQNLANARDDAFFRLRHLTEAEGAQNFALSETRKAHAAAKSEVELLSATRTKGDPILQEAINKETQLGRFVGYTEKALASVQKEQTKADAAHIEAGRKVDDHKGKLNDLQTKLNDLMTKNSELTNQVRSPEYWLEISKKSYGDTKFHLDALVKATGEMGPAFDAMKDPAKQAGDKLTETAIATERTAQAMATVIKQKAEFLETLREMAKQAAETAGEGAAP